MTPAEIRGLRQRLGDTQAEFAARFGVSTISVSYWESGRSQPVRRRLDELGALASRAAKASSAVVPSFRPIQYLGSKQRLADAIVGVMGEIAPGGGRVGDLFAGSGVVSRALGSGRPVTAVDVQRYSEVLTRALLLGKPEDFACLCEPTFVAKVAEVDASIRRSLDTLVEFEIEAMRLASDGKAEALVNLIEHGSIAAHLQRSSKVCAPALAKRLTAAERELRTSGFTNADLTATRYFGGPYFSYAQAATLDAVAVAAGSTLGPAAKRAAMAVLLSTASEIVNTVGKQFAQPMKLRKADGRIPSLLLERTVRDRSMNVLDTFRTWAERWRANAPCGRGDHVVHCGDVVSFVGKDRSCRAYYADPPYTIDHYSRFYHVLETLVLRDSPRLDEMNKRGELAVLRGVYRAKRFQSAFCIPSEVSSAFEALIRAAARRKVPLLLSYSPFDADEGHRPRLLTLDALVDIANQSYRRVTVREISEHSHRKLNAKAQNAGVRTDAERLIICEV